MSGIVVSGSSDDAVEIAAFDVGMNGVFLKRPRMFRGMQRPLGDVWRKARGYKIFISFQF
jgi:hypothetical protein